MPAIANGMIICTLIVFIYAIIGISFFKGKFYHCDLEDSSLLVNIITRQDCIDAGGEWENNEKNFDNISNALSILFEIITTEGWLDIMYYGVDCIGIGMEPKKNSQPELAFYFISFIIVGNIFILNLFVGIVIDKFNRLKDRMCGYALMTNNQIEWVESEMQMIRLQLQKLKNPPTQPNRLMAYKICHH